MNNDSKWLLIIVTVLAACTGSETARPADAVRDSAGVRIVESSPPNDTWIVAAAPELRIGVIEGDSAYQFHNISHAARLSDGRIIVIDGGTEIRWFSPDGTHRSTLGRRGDGPGEFRSIQSVVITPDDSVIVHDAGSQRISWLSPDETLVRVGPLRGTGTQGVRLLTVRPHAVAIVAESRPTFNFGGEEFNYSRDTLVVTNHAPESMDTIATVVGTESATWVYYENARPTRTMQMELPFGHLALAAATSRSVVLAATEDRQLALLDDTGRVHALVRAASTETVSADLRSRFVTHAEQQAIDRGAPDPQIIRKGAEDRLLLLADDHTMPAFDRLLVDTGDRIWMRDYVPPWAIDQPQQWTVHGSDGLPLARVTTPAGMMVTSISNDYVVGVEPDELNVQYVVLYRLER
jgi:hypothetical protein